jgi:hypothetical protein
MCSRMITFGTRQVKCRLYKKHKMEVYKNSVYKPTLRKWLICVKLVFRLLLPQHCQIKPCAWWPEGHCVCLSFYSGVLLILLCTDVWNAEFLPHVFHFTVEPCRFFLRGMNGFLRYCKLKHCDLWKFWYILRRKRYDMFDLCRISDLVALNV